MQERADHVLRFGQIDAHLAAHGAIDLGQQRRGDLQEAESAGVGGGDEAGQVADHAAADGHDDRLAIGAEFQHALPQAGGHFDRLALLARLDDHHVDLDVLLAKAFGHSHGVRLLHVLVGDDHGVRHLAAIREEPARRGQVARADLDIVAPLGQIDADGFGRMGSRAARSAASRSAGGDGDLGGMKPTGSRTYSNSAAWAGSACSRASIRSRSTRLAGPCSTPRAKWSATP